MQLVRVGLHLGSYPKVVYVKITFEYILAKYTVQNNDSASLNLYC